MYVLVRQDLLQHLFTGSILNIFHGAGVPVCVVNQLSIVLCVYPDLRVSVCCFRVRNGSSIIVSSTLVASRGVTGHY